MCQGPEDIKRLFAQHRLRCTQQRLDVYTALRHTPAHPTAEELHKIVNADQGGTSLATVYNTLEALERAGLARRISVPSGGTRFDATVEEHLHIVQPDGSVLDVPGSIGTSVLDAVTPEITQRLREELGVEIDRIEVQLHARPTAN